MADKNDDYDKNDICATAKKRFIRARDAYSKQRTLASADTRFALGDSDNKWQWPDQIFTERQNDRRVALTVNVTAQHCNQIINEIRRNRPMTKVSPADSEADVKTAELLGGLVRNIQSARQADEAHDTGAEHCIYGGEGYWRIITEYENETSFDQVICIKPIPDPRLAYIDPGARELDRSDAQWGFVFEDVPTEEVKRQYPNIDPTSWSDDDRSREWFTDDTIRIAEYFWCEKEKDTALFLSDGTTMLKSEFNKIGPPPEGIMILRERPTEIAKWYWAKLVGGEDKPVEQKKWPGKYLPIIMAVGKETWVDGDVIRKGQVRDLKDMGRMINYSYSETVQTLALQNKIPYTGTVEAIEGHEQQWRDANRSNDAILLWNARDADGNVLPEPKRQLPAVMPTAQIELLKLSTEEMRAASGQQAVNFGIRSDAQSGIGIQRLKVQGEVATFHFPDNLSRALRYEAIVIIDLIQKTYDTRRVVRILGLDGKQSSAVLDPNSDQPYVEQETLQAVERIFNPNVGRYDVTIDTGPSYQTQRQESAVALADMANHAKDPVSGAVLQYLAIKSADFVGSQEAADMLQKALPPQFQEKEGQPNIPPQVAQQMQQMGQQMQMMGQALQEAQQKLQEAQSGTEAAIQKAMIDANVKREQGQIQAQADAEQAERDAALAIRKAQIDAATKIRVALINAGVKREISEWEAEIGMDQHEMDCAADVMKHKMTVQAKKEEENDESETTQTKDSEG